MLASGTPETLVLLHLGSTAVRSLLDQIIERNPEPGTRQTGTLRILPRMTRGMSKDKGGLGKGLERDTRDPRASPSRGDRSKLSLPHVRLRTPLACSNGHAPSHLGARI
ncbi:hypothetical protein FRB94_001130 [Tulasnella sp. JGI-2019a]|nr:hypothetical protein FRB94_001130 [Tulasnella sp. JGI-2019a]